MPAGTNSARGRFYPRGIDTGRDPEGGDCGETTIPRRDRRERAFERDGEDAENPVRDPARRVVRATPRGSRSRRPPSVSNIPCVSSSVLSTWGARWLRKDSLRDRVEFGFDISVQKRALFRATWARCAKKMMRRE
jgi:hypothetical protein